jgi:hypothetical protein
VEIPAGYLMRPTLTVELKSDQHVNFKGQLQDFLDLRVKKLLFKKSMARILQKERKVSLDLEFDFDDSFVNEFDFKILIYNAQGYLSILNKDNQLSLNGRTYLPEIYLDRDTQSATFHFKNVVLSSTSLHHMFLNVQSTILTELAPGTLTFDFWILSARNSTHLEVLKSKLSIGCGSSCRMCSWLSDLTCIECEYGFRMQGMVCNPIPPKLTLLELLGREYGLSRGTTIGLSLMGVLAITVWMRQSVVLQKGAVSPKTIGKIASSGLSSALAILVFIHSFSNQNEAGSWLSGFSVMVTVFLNMVIMCGYQVSSKPYSFMDFSSIATKKAVFHRLYGNLVHFSSLYYFVLDTSIIINIQATEADLSRKPRKDRLLPQKTGEVSLDDVAGRHKLKRPKKSKSEDDIKEPQNSPSENANEQSTNKQRDGQDQKMMCSLIDKKKDLVSFFELSRKINLSFKVFLLLGNLAISAYYCYTKEFRSIYIEYLLVLCLEIWTYIPSLMFVDKEWSEDGLKNPKKEEDIKKLLCSVKANQETVLEQPEEPQASWQHILQSIVEKKEKENDLSDETKSIEIEHFYDKFQHDFLDFEQKAVSELAQRRKNRTLSGDSQVLNFFEIDWVMKGLKKGTTRFTKLEAAIDKEQSPEGSTKSLESEKEGTGDRKRQTKANGEKHNE